MRNTLSNQITILWIRHGKTPGNEEKRYIGRTDEELSEQGILELKEKQYPKADFIFTSPMKRCKQTAELLYPTVESMEIPDLRETDFGDFEGKNYIELSGDVRYQEWIDSNGELPFPNGESKKEVMERTMTGIRQMLAKIQEIKCATGRSSITVAAIVHGGTIMTVLSELFGGDYYDYQVKNGQGYWSVIEEKDGFQITSIKELWSD